MKKLLIALLMLMGAVAFAPKAQADQYMKVWNGHCYNIVRKPYGYRSNFYCPPRYRASYYGPSRVYYSQPVRYYRNYDYCERPARNYNAVPRFSISFGF